MKGNVMEKFNMLRSKEDVIAHKQWLENIFSTYSQDGGCISIDLPKVYECLKR